MLEEMYCSKFLGIYLDPGLTWNDHIDHVCSNWPLLTIHARVSRETLNLRLFPRTYSWDERGPLWMALDVQGVSQGTTFFPVSSTARAGPPNRAETEECERQRPSLVDISIRKTAPVGKVVEDCPTQKVGAR
ncbi:hypothetical protein J6590_004515 [Homalodisca vitripennis]|nr:hypothetical protein J6590_004515 [Homalodisca vitripennis]